jgi:hypothetical protein
LVLQRLEHELPVARDHRKHVVEVVCDAAGEQPYRLHLLSLDQLALETPPLGDVAHHDDATDGHSYVVVQGRDRHGDDRSVDLRVADEHLPLVEPLSAHGQRQRVHRERGSLIRLVQAAAADPVFGIQVRLADPQDLFHLRIRE